jgi:hypothetical protein
MPDVGTDRCQSVSDATPWALPYASISGDS